MSFPDAFLQCLIPPFIWIIILFLDGDYVACGSTSWKGNYVFDEELNRMWCKPAPRARAGKESDLRQKYHVFIYKSKALGYAVITFLSLLIIIVGLYECCCFRRRPETQKALQGGGQQPKTHVPVPNFTPSEGSGLKEEES
ncbi:uncharacterized protein LOC130549000 isoform X2 [Triplophysa rosa]|nr:uncharacterized protein LOC130548999 isoform X2 [Triplophysa rosa]XP_057182104.1 uncharacterized protein LOC130549000 isoform X2 [Triplophysa rosa]